MSWDAHELGGRPLFAWAPDDRSRAYPTVYVLHAHMRSARWWFNVDPFVPSYPEVIDQLVPGAVVVLVDGWTDLGGGQWIGELASYLRDDVVPFVDGAYPTTGLRGLQGKSSGGYGALVNAMERPDLFHAVAAHAPDALFEVTLAHGFPAAARELRERFGGSVDAFWESFAGLESHGDALLVELSAAAHAFGGSLPFAAHGRVLPAFEQWLEHAPVRLAADFDEAVRSWRGVWLDAGRSDQYFLDLGASALRDALLSAGLADDRLHFELIEGGHGGMSHRYPLSLAWLVERLQDA